MFQAAEHAEISPLRLGFTGSLRVVRRAVAKFQDAQPQEILLSWLLEEIAAQKIPPRQGRSNPRVVKKPRAKFPSRKRLHRGSGTKLEKLTFTIPNTA
jgi:hypothetical protein